MKQSIYTDLFLTLRLIGSNGMAHKKIWNTTQKKTMIFQLFGHTKMAHKKDDFFGSKIHINRQKMFLK